MKRKLIFIGAIVFIVMKHTCMFCHEATNFLSVIDDIDLDLNFKPLDKPYYDAASVLKLITRACPIDEMSICDAQAILRQDFYKRTNPINQRSLLDLPQFYYASYRPDLRCAGQPWQLSFQLFLNYTNKCFFTQTGDQLVSYLALDNANLVPDLQDLGFDVNLIRILGLLGTAKLTQYRTGLMASAQWLRNPWYIEWKFPIEYMLRHFDLPQAEEDALRRELATMEDPETEMEFARRHLIADRVGIGDMRLDLQYLVINDSSCQCYVGSESTIPIAWAFKKGPYGNHFRKNKPAPTLDLVELLNLINSDFPLAQEIGTQFLLAALDRLSRILLEDGLGNNGHVGTGPLIMCDLQVRKKLHFKLRAVLEYLFPAKERRFYIKKKNIARFNQLFQQGTDECLFDENNCETQLEFLQQQLIDTLFPMGYDTVVWPGFIFKFTTALTGDIGKNWKMTIGYDAWWHQQEMLGSIDAPQNEKEMLRKSLARRPQAFQCKIWGTISYAKSDVSYDWAMSLHGDTTFITSGIGRDINLGLGLEILL